MIYLDNSATTPIDEEVLETMKKYLAKDYYNLSAIYPKAKEVKKAIETARSQVADL